MSVHILAVCIGNVCRSPVIERLLAARLAPEVAAGTVSVASAGVHALVGRAIEPRSAEALTALGGEAAGFAARRLEPAHVEPADLVLTATVDVRAEALGVFPRAMRRTFTLLEFAELCRNLPAGEGETLPQYVARAAAARAQVAGADLDLADPIGRSAETHTAVAEQIDAAVSIVAERVRELT